MHKENKMPGGAEILPAYKLDLFVGRKAEIEQITNWVKQPQPRGGQSQTVYTGQARFSLCFFG